MLPFFTVAIVFTLMGAYALARTGHQRTAIAAFLALAALRLHGSHVLRLDR
jgi:hypothetical protein